MEALWRRLAFNILISNTDDHLRNFNTVVWAVEASQEEHRLAGDENAAPRYFPIVEHLYALPAA